MPDVSGLYPQPPQPGQGILTGDPMRTIGAIGELQNIGIRANQAPALSQIPGQELTNLRVRQQNEQMAQQADVLARTRAAYGAAWGPREGKIDEREFHNFTANYVKANPVDAQLYPSIINSVAESIMNDPITGQSDPTGISTRARRILSQALPPSVAGTPTGGPPGVGGTPTAQSGAAAAQRGAYPVGQPVGEEIGQKGAAESATALENSGNQSYLVHSNLDLLKQDSQVLGKLGGPSTALERPLNALAQRLGLVGVTMTPEELKSADSFDKIVNQMSVTQANLFGSAGATDAARAMTLHANPNTQMTQKSREAMIDMLHGNQDAFDKMREIWAQARGSGMPRSSFNDAVRQFTMMPLNKKGATFDPRVFQFNRMNPESRQDFLHSMTPAQAKKFENNAEEAQARGWIDINAPQQP